MRRTLIVLFGMWLSVSPAVAQQAQQPQQQTPVPRAPVPPPPPEQEPGEKVIRAFTDLVLVDVQVTDRDGRLVKGLKQEQFTVLENGQRQKIAFFDYYDIEQMETAGAVDAAPVVVALGAPAPTERVREQVRDRRLVVLFFDLTSMQADALLRATAAAQKFVAEQMTPADLVAVLAFGNRLGVLAHFTSDKALLQQAIARLVPGKDSQLADVAGAVAPAGEEAVAEDTGAAFTADETEFNIFNTDRKLAALEAVADLLRGVPGRKAVIHFSSGITQTGEENRSQLRATTDAANRANVSLYAMDTSGLQAEVPGGNASAGAAGGTAMFSGAAVFRQSGARQESRDTLTTLASDTGGESFFDEGDLGKVFAKVQQDTAGYYLMGFYSSDARRDGKWRELKVRVEGSGLRVRNREGYYAPKEYGVFTAEDRERQLEEAMRSELPRVELPMALETAWFRLSRDEVFVPVAVKLASRALQWAEERNRREVTFDFMLEVRHAGSGFPAGALRDTVRVRLDEQRFQQVQQRAIVYQGGVILAPGSYRIKFLARENETGRIGTFERDLELPAAAPQRLEVSPVLLSSQIEKVAGNGEVETKALTQDAKLKRSPLEVGGERVIPSVTRVFTTEQRLFVLFQTYLPNRADATKLRGGLVFFRNGERINETPLVEAAEYDEKTHTAAFRLSLPLERMAPGAYVVQAVCIEAGSTQAAFSRTNFALRPPAAAKPVAAPGQ